MKRRFHDECMDMNGSQQERSMRNRERTVIVFSIIFLTVMPAWASGETVSAASSPSSENASTDPARGTDERPEPLPSDGPALMKIMTDEIAAGLRQRKLDSGFSQFQNYAGYQLNRSTGTRAGGEVTGNCRLSWFDHLLRNPLQAPAESEAFTRELFDSLSQRHGGLEKAIAIAREKTDVYGQPNSLTLSCELDSGELDSGELNSDPLQVVQLVLEHVQQSHARSLAPLTSSEINQLQRDAYTVLVSQNDVGYTLANRRAGRRACDLLEKIDRDALHDAASAMAILADPEFLDRLSRLPEQGSAKVRGVSGTVLQKIVTPAGSILVGGRGANTYDLDELSDVNVVIDLGGNDTYREGTVSLARPVLITLDLSGDDHYVGSKPGIQGGAILGAAMLVDVSGNDRYQARDVAQASCVGGVGMLIDHAGDDRYQGFRRVQGQALAGLGMLVDRDGNDQYHGAMWTQGMGGPLGFATLADLSGNDRYYTGGHFICSYADDEDNPTPGYEGWGQGVGAGLRSVCSGGIGVILDGDGDDVYEFDYLSHGGGYWLGLGFARDFGGNDQRVGATMKSYDGSPRTEKRFQRFGGGFGCHYAAGFCIDDRGDDTYNGTIMGIGHGWDCSIGVLSDFEGNDQYASRGKTTQGNGSQASLGILFDYDGDDRYRNYTQGYAPSSISYHEMPHCGGNFSFLIDLGGTDGYGCRAKNNSIVRQGSNGGFLVDRSKPGETLKVKAGATGTRSGRTSTSQSRRTATRQPSRGSSSR